jgi:O-antigen/teichoic acid export membrane protein
MDAQYVGFYNAAIPIAALLTMAPDLFTRMFFPLITKEFSRKRIEHINQLSKQVSKWIFVLNLPLFALIIVFPGVFINFIFGKEYLIAENALRLLAIGSLFASLAVIPSNLLFMKGKSKTVLVNTIILFFFNIILNIVLVKRYGMSGVAFATMSTFILLFLIYMIQAKIFLNIIPVRRKMLDISIISILITLLLIYIKQFIQINLISLILLGSLFVLLYILAILLTGCLDKNDLVVIKSIKKKILFYISPNQPSLSEH